MWPLTKRAASLARNTAAGARSSTSPQRRLGVRLIEPGAEGLVGHQRGGQLGLEVARAQAVDGDAVRPEVDRHALGQHLHRTLAGRVGRDAGAAQLALHRADVDDAAAPARHHALRHRLADDEHAVDIGAHQLLPVGEREFVEGRAALQAGVVDEHVDGADLFLDRRHRGAHGGHIADVEGTCMDLQALARQQQLCGGQPRRVAPVQHQRGAGLAEPARQREADARRRAGDQCHAAVQTKGVGGDHAGVHSSCCLTVASTSAGLAATSSVIAPSSGSGDSRMSSWLCSSEAGM